jgi:hypothetical protein
MGKLLAKLTKSIRTVFLLGSTPNAFEHDYLNGPPDTVLLAQVLMLLILFMS